MFSKRLISIQFNSNSNVEEQSNVEDEDGANLELRNDADQQANQDDVHSMYCSITILQFYPFTKIWIKKGEITILLCSKDTVTATLLF